MTSPEQHLIDLKFLLDQKEQVDMSPEAVTQRMKALSELCKLAETLQVSDIYPFRADYEWRSGSN